MKKNKMMRLASSLMVAVLLTTSMISGTFAKYVTEVSGKDEARVAKWGIMMGKDGDLFETTYDTGNITVDGKTDKVVAPGTTDKTTYSVTGTPETDYVISFNGNAVKDVFLKKDSVYTYPENYTKPGTGNITVAEDYYPINYSITIATTNGTVTGSGWAAGTAKTFDSLSDALADLNLAKVTYDSNETCDLKVTIEWEWLFDSSKEPTLGTRKVTNDVYDTILGDLAAMRTPTSVALTTSAVDGTGYGLDISYNLTMTATQID